MEAVLGVSASQQPRRHLEAEGAGSRKIDDKLKFGRLHHRQVGGLHTLEDAIDVGGRITKLVDRIRAIGDQAAARDEIAVRVDRGQSVPAVIIELAQQAPGEHVG